MERLPFVLFVCVPPGTLTYLKAHTAAVVVLRVATLVGRCGVGGSDIGGVVTDMSGYDIEDCRPWTSRTTWSWPDAVGSPCS